MTVSCDARTHVDWHDVTAALPQGPLYGTVDEPGNNGVGWLLSPSPFEISTRHLELLNRLGDCLYRFSVAVDTLYKRSQKEESLYWVQRIFQVGKPEFLLMFARMNRFKSQVPLVIRPDLLFASEGFTLCEIDAVPGGIGFTSALHQAYQTLGFPLVGTSGRMVDRFLAMLQSQVSDEIRDPSIAVILSDEAADYRLEMTWVVEQIQQTYPNIVLIHPRQVSFERNRLGWLDEDERFHPIDLIYRFFELFDLPNIPQIDLIQYAIKKGLVRCTPPFKPHLEEKLVLALLYHPVLEAFWQEALGESDVALLKSVVPESWVLDPAVVPLHAHVVPELAMAGRTFRDFSELGQTTQKQRELVIKPSGFSPLAWGSRGVSIGHDMPQDRWQETLNEAMAQFGQTPHLLQRFQPASIHPYTYFDPISHDPVQAEGRTRLCPYYFVIDGTVELVGVLATTCPKDKKVIHGMRDGVMHPVMVKYHYNDEN